MAAEAESRTLSKRQEPESLRLRALMPSYTVNDLQQSLAWYRGWAGIFRFGALGRGRDVTWRDVEGGGLSAWPLSR